MKDYYVSYTHPQNPKSDGVLKWEICSRRWLRLKGSVLKNPDRFFNLILMLKVARRRTMWRDLGSVFSSRELQLIDWCGLRTSTDEGTIQSTSAVVKISSTILLKWRGDEILILESSGSERLSGQDIVIFKFESQLKPINNLVNGPRDEKRIKPSCFRSYGGFCHDNSHSRCFSRISLRNEILTRLEIDNMARRQPEKRQISELNDQLDVGDKSHNLLARDKINHAGEKSRSPIDVAALLPNSKIPKNQPPWTCFSCFARWIWDKSWRFHRAVSMS